MNDEFNTGNKGRNSRHTSFFEREDSIGIRIETSCNSNPLMKISQKSSRLPRTHKNVLGEKEPSA